MARPSKYTPELVNEICSRLSKGEPLAVICRDDHMPDPSTIHDWTNGSVASAEDISRDIARARESGFDTIAHDVRSTARGLGESTGDVQRDKLIIETDLKLLAKWSKRYSDHYHRDPSPVPVNNTLVITSAILDALPMEQLEAIKAKFGLGSAQALPVVTIDHEASAPES